MKIPWRRVVGWLLKEGERKALRELQRRAAARATPMSEPIQCPKCDTTIRPEPLPGNRFFCSGCAHTFDGPPRPAADSEGSTQSHRAHRNLIVLFGLALASIAHAQTDPRTLPRVQPADFVKESTFTYPTDDGRHLANGGSLLTWNAGVLGLDGKGGLYVRCHDWFTRIASVSIPAPGAASLVTSQCADVPNLWAINPGDPNSLKLGGAMSWQGSAIVSAYPYYDGNGTAVASHFVGASSAALTGMPATLATGVPGWRPGFVSGAMSEVPAEWRAVLGGPALTGQCCLAVIARTSYGPSVSVFDPASLVAGGTSRARALIGYPEAHQTLGAWLGPDTNGYNLNSKLGVVFIVPGSRTVAFVGGRGGTYCYGTGTSDQTLAGKPDGQGNIYCYDPVDNGKGGHGYPYGSALWLYDLADVLAAASPWDARPYFYGAFPGITQRIVGGAMDVATGRLYVTTGNTDAPQIVTVFKVGASGAPPPPPPPPPVDPCKVNPLVVVVNQWPSPVEGRRTLSYTATVANVVVTATEVRHIWTAPQRLLFTDSRNCSVEVTKR